MKAPQPAFLPRGPRALRVLGRRAAIVSPLTPTRRRLHAPRAVADGSVGNAAPLPAASASSGLSPTPGSCSVRGAVLLLMLRARCFLSRPRLAVFPARCKPFSLPDAVHATRDTGGVDGEGRECGRPSLWRQLTVLRVPGCLHSFSAFADPGRLIGRSVPVSKDLFDFADNCGRRHQLRFVFFRDDPPRWPVGLGCGTAGFSSRVDRTGTFREAENELPNGGFHSCPCILLTPIAPCVLGLHLFNGQGARSCRWERPNISNQPSQR
jgi:hypothetical protein